MPGAPALSRLRAAAGATLLAMVALPACASRPRTPDLVAPPPAYVDTFPDRVQQGSLVRARATIGSRVELLDAQGKATEIRVGLDGGYVLGVALWWLVIFAGLSGAGLGWIVAALLATPLSGFWPLLTRS